MYKKIIPLLLLVGIVIVIAAACKTDEPEAAPDAAEISAAVEAAEEAQAHEEEAEEDHEDSFAEAGEEPAHEEEGDTEHQDPLEEDPDVPAFVPPQPADISVDPETVAFAIGDPEAPVQIVEFSDYQCPYCGRHALQTLPTLVEELVDSGQVYYAIKDLPLPNHPEAGDAALAARCAGEQEAYLAMHDAIYASQSEWSGQGAAAMDYFMGLAEELELDAETFAACQADDRQQANVSANVMEAIEIGVSSTPFFFIDGFGMSGAQPMEAFAMAAELAEKDKLDDVITAQARAAYDQMLAQQQAAPPPIDPAAVSLENSHAIGDAAAPVTIVEYTDYQCPFCSRHADQTFNQIEENLIDTGKVRYVFKDFPLTSIHPQAVLAAEAARCAGEEGTDEFVAMHDMLFVKQREWSGSNDAAAIFSGYAAEIGVDQDSFNACLENHDFAAAVQADLQEGAALGITGTPAFLVNGELVVGAQPYEIFAQVVDSFIAVEENPPAGN